MSIKSHSRMSFRDWRISWKLKFSSLARGALAGKRAWMNFFSLSVNHDAVSGTDICLS